MFFLLYTSFLSSILVLSTLESRLSFTFDGDGNRRCLFGAEIKVDGLNAIVQNVKGFYLGVEGILWQLEEIPKSLQ
jgi:hypothetical protein